MAVKQYNLGVYYLYNEIDDTISLGLIDKMVARAAILSPAMKGTQWHTSKTKDQTLGLTATESYTIALEQQQKQIYQKIQVQDAHQAIAELKRIGERNGLSPSDLSIASSTSSPPRNTRFPQGSSLAPLQKEWISDWLAHYPSRWQGDRSDRNRS